ncbi:zinc finger protein 354A-like isoform X3 [Homalodisca vitripennis]|uniref:zinc finger protein 354A-like isoform X3 n=1 Tax=Homalodisca vitripennis TaxID=197043 RepID=UPI001EEB71B7|nr:zinc finger protein 354A-like isoform X3 [Homalodisca vitripennis]
MDANKSWSSGFEFVDIEIIDHKNETEKEKPVEKFKCDQCSLFFLNKEKLILHQKKHVTESEESVKCRYCNKILSITEESKESYSNRKCETCEYRCTICPQRFLRHSSLLNHEKNHKLPRKKRTSLINRKRINGLKTPYNIENRVSKRGRPRKYPLIASNTTNKEKENSELGISPKKKQKIQSESSGSDDSTVNLDNEVSPNTKTLKRSSVRAGKSSAEVMSSPTKNKTNTALSSSPLSTQISENGVNYKPFSCHVCGDHFVSDSVLLEHIKTHGDVTKGFKCKHCDDEFVDIYKMQFHLAICPFAEDELETSIKKNSLPPQFLAKQSVTVNEIPRKRGRPRKIKTDMPQNSEEVHKPVTTTAKRYSIKRKSDDPAGSVIKTPRGVRTSLPVRFRKNSRSKSLVTDTSSGINEQGESHSDDNVDDDSEDVMVDDDLNTSTKNDHLDSGDEERKKMHACPFPRCDFKFTREKALLCHMRNHNDDFDEVLKCHKCDIPFDDLRSLRIHIDDCKGIKEEKDDDFEEPDDPDIDDQSEGVFHTFQRSKGSFLCKVCGRAYNTAAKLKSHNCQGANPLSMVFPCRLCGEQLISQALLKKHFAENHPDRKVYQCPTCQMEFDDLVEANDHMMAHIKNNYECSVCFEKLLTKPKLMDHYAEYHPGVDRSTCSICNKKYSDPSALAKHRHVHTGERPFQCPICYMTFTLKCSQVVHLRRHTNYRPYKCKNCPKTFFNCGDLRKHNRRHTGERPYQCGVCNYRFTLKESLNNHVKTHLVERPFQCAHCPRAFTTKTNLKNHIHLHGEAAPYQCPLCSDTFYQLGHVRTHLKNNHIDEFGKDFMCEICRKDQGNPLQLLQHLMSHDINKVKEENTLSNVANGNTDSESMPVVKRKRGRPRKHPVPPVYNAITKRNGQKRFYIKTEKSAAPIEVRLRKTRTKKLKSDSTLLENSDGVVKDEIKVEDEETDGIYEVAKYEPVVKDEFSCTMCNSVFTCFEGLLNHVQIHI